MLKIESSHPLFTTQAVVAQACSKLFRQFNLSYFQYLRCYDDGSFSLLCNDLRLITYLMQPENARLVKDEPALYSAFDESNQHKQQFWFSWDESLPEFPVQLAKQKFHIHNGITLMRREKHHYDMIGFAMPNPIQNTFGYYANILGELEHFIDTFEQHEATHIQTVEHHRILVPTHHKDPNRFDLCLKKGRLDITNDEIDSYITLQELHCLRQFNQGTPIKSIAKKLHISPRTVETYLQRVKYRTGLTLNHPLLLNL
ncbi:MAG: LuxR C-terminal-related transcriptional regulator [Legionellaceae bacterium]|nr:LuxR C-terminal-related transcriptional regulator [Legionellaceae bacterium]